MRQGKISENVLKRSVLKKIKTHRKEIVSGAGIGKDCAILASLEGEEIALSVTPVTAPLTELGSYAIPMALNNVAAAGAEPVGVMLSILLPEQTEETEIQQFMEQAEEVCAACHVEIAGGHTEVTAAVDQPIMTVTGIGKKEAARAGYPQGIKANQDIVVSKWIGLEGTVRLAKEHKNELCTRYPVRMIEEAAAYNKYLSIIPEAATAMKSGVCGMHDVSRGGIFGALWEMASGAGVGLEIDLKKLPVKQETIEICEFFELNPYELLSGGCLIMVTEDGNGLVAALAREEIPAVIVGKTTDSNDRVLYNDDEKRYLDMPKTDQMYHMM
ncbi:MAG: AIR synthase family protein [Lachnospiraceae bacterium]|nr:AIR synthase family protein [Lachnospiraceae bacterium]